MASTVANQTMPLQSAGRVRNADTAHTQHGCDEFLSEIEIVRARAVASHQEPPCEPLTRHGYVGIEAEIVAKITAWIEAN